MENNYTINSLAALSSLVHLNVYVLTQDSLLSAWDNVTSSAYAIFRIPERSLLQQVEVDRPAEYEVITTSYQERYMIFVLPDMTYLAIGPFLLETGNTALVRSALRLLHMPLAESGEFLRHYSTLPVHSRRFCQSLLALLEQMYPAKGASIKPEISIHRKGSVIARHYQGAVAEDRMMYRVRSPIALENKLLHHIEQGDWSNALDTLKNINSLDSAVFSADPVQSKRYSLVAGCTLYTRAIIRAGIDYMTAFALSDAMIRTIHDTTTLEELIDFEYEMLELYCEQVQEKKKGKYSVPVSRAIEYISVNLTEKITLADLGEHVHLHPNYFSNLFRKEVGVPVSKYIQQMRIEESKLLLAGTHENIAAISNYYQFCNEAYYIRVFRSHEGMTPNEYRTKSAHTQP